MKHLKIRITIAIIIMSLSCVISSYGQKRTGFINKMSVGAGIQYPIFPNETWIPDPNIPKPMQTWDHLADSINYFSTISWNITIKYDIPIIKNTYLTIGVGINNINFKKDNFYNEILFDSLHYLPVKQTINNYKLNIPLLIKYKLHNFSFSAGINYLPIWKKIRHNQFIDNSKRTFKSYYGYNPAVSPTITAMYSIYYFKSIILKPEIKFCFDPIQSINTNLLNVSLYIQLKKSKK